MFFVSKKQSAINLCFKERSGQLFAQWACTGYDNQQHGYDNGNRNTAETAIQPTKQNNKCLVETYNLDHLILYEGLKYEVISELILWAYKEHSFI